MKNILSVIHLLLVAVLLASCYSSSDKSTITTVTLTPDRLEGSSVLRIDTIGTFEELFLYAKEFLVYDDSILIVLNKKHTDGFFLEFYNLSHQKSMRKMYRLGNGPTEMLSAKIYLNKDTLNVTDYVKGQVAFVNMDSVVKNPLYNPLPIKHQVNGSYHAIAYKDSFLLENPYCFADKRIGIEQNAPRFIVTDGKRPYTYATNYKYYTRNVVAGSIISNYFKQKIVYACMNSSRIEIYDTALRLQKIIEGPIRLEADYSVSNEYDNNEVIFKTNIPYAYLDYCVDDDYLYLTYFGDVLPHNRNMKDYPNWILKYDWEGNLIKSYFLDGYILAISKGSAKECLYIAVMNDDDVPLLLKAYLLL